MLRSISAFRAGSDFDAFVFATVGEDKNGMLLSVLSALARQNVDPWQEAAELARLPREIATQKLTPLIAGLPGGELSVHQDAPATAARLIALLPRRLDIGLPLRQPRPGVGAASSFRLSLIVMIFVVLVASDWCIMTSHERQAHVANVAASPPVVLQRMAPPHFHP
jgi:hypothetical protein